MEIATKLPRDVFQHMMNFYNPVSPTAQCIKHLQQTYDEFYKLIHTIEFMQGYHIIQGFLTEMQSSRYLKIKIYKYPFSVNTLFFNFFFDNSWCAVSLPDL